jgi:WD40 repeat protein
MFPDTQFRTYALLFVVFLVAMGSVAGMHGCRSKTWPEHDGRLVKAVRGDSEFVYDIEFSADGKWVFTCGQDGIKQWDAATCKLVHEQEFDFESRGYRIAIYSMAADVHRPLLYLGTLTQEVYVWNYETRQVVGTIPTRERWSKSVRALATSPDGKLLAIAENSGLVKRKSKPEDFTILIWDLENEREVGRLIGHREPIGWLFFLPGSQSLIARSETVNTVWDVRDLSLTAHSGTEAINEDRETEFPMNNLALAILHNSPAGNDMESQRSFSEIFSEYIDLIRKLKGNTYCVVGNDEGQVQVFDGQGRIVDTFQQFGNGCSVDAVAVSPDGKLLVSGGDGAAMGGFGIRDDQRSRNLCFWRLDKKK